MYLKYLKSQTFIKSILWVSTNDNFLIKLLLRETFLYVFKWEKKDPDSNRFLLWKNISCVIFYRWILTQLWHGLKVIKENFWS